MATCPTLGFPPDSDHFFGKKLWDETVLSKFFWKRPIVLFTTLIFLLIKSWCAFNRKEKKTSGMFKTLTPMRSLQSSSTSSIINHQAANGWRVKRRDTKKWQSTSFMWCNPLWTGYPFFQVENKFALVIPGEMWQDFEWHEVCNITGHLPVESQTFSAKHQWARSFNFFRWVGLRFRFVFLRQKTWDELIGWLIWTNLFFLRQKHEQMCLVRCQNRSILRWSFQNTMVLGNRNVCLCGFSPNLTRVSSKSALQECQVRGSYKSIKSECLTRVSGKSVP